MYLVLIQTLPLRCIAGIAAFRDHAGFMDALEQEFGVAMPTTPRCVRAGDVAVSCVAPSRYVAMGAQGSGLLERLAGRLAGLAAVTDQSDMWAMFVISGDAATEMLAKVVPIDLRDAQFREGDVALTRAGHLDVRLWRLAHGDYEIAVTRSMADDLRYVLEQSRAGMQVA